jgi:alcohol dehydrogenase class IV
MAVNVRALQERHPESEALQRYHEIARILTGDPHATAQDGIAWIEDLCTDLRIPPLSSYGVRQRDFPTLIDKASVASSMKGNPLPLARDEMEDILARAL